MELMHTPLHEVLKRAGARFTEFWGWETPETFGDFRAEYNALKLAAGVVDLSFRGKLAATGADRQDFLHRMVSNQVNGLAPGQGNYCFLLNAQGHILADMNLLVQAERILLDCEPFVTGKLREALEKFVIADDVELHDLSAQLGTIGIEGPLCREVVASVLGLEPPHMKPLEHFSPEATDDFLLARQSITGQGSVAGFWLIAPAARLPELWERLAEAARPLGGGPVGLAALETARIEAGIPRYGADIEEKTLPQETGQFRAISFDKGCYPGQEIVERIRSRGHVNRRLVGLMAAPGEALRAGTSVQAGGRDVGRVTSAAHSPGIGRSIALAYLRREAAEPGAEVSVDGVPAEVAPVPFPRR